MSLIASVIDHDRGLTVLVGSDKMLPLGESVSAAAE
jgi:hypothetical protein